MFRDGGWATPSGKQIAVEDLRAHLRSKDITDVLATVTGEQLEKLDQAAAVLPIAAICERAQNSPLQKRVHVRTWLSRGLSAGQNAGAGHIRWGKIAQGLKASLGEFTAVDRGSLSRGCHEIHVVLADGSIADGFVDAGGQSLSPKIQIPNRSKLRYEMTKALRMFCGGTRLGSVGLN